MSDFDERGFRRNAVTIRVSNEMLEFGSTLRDLMDRAIDYRVHPWRYADRNPMPHFDWWPWIDTARAAPAEYRARFAHAWDTLRHGVPPENEDY